MTPEELKDIEERHSCLLKGGPIDMGMVIELARGIGDIGKLLSHIKELESQIPRWIPVEERLPEEKAIVTACIKNRRVFPDVFYIEGCWYSAKGIVEGVTHWMPLPKGPEE